MRIQHNIAALNAHRQLGGNNTAVGKSLEKLSSGFRINRAGDDAAGLAISEKMRAQITSLDTAQKNANDGISLIQTAEGALTEVHSMLNRMVEISMQSANGIYDDKVDRTNLQEEFDQLRTEINRIADTTTFNGTKLLDGTKGTITLQIGDTAASSNMLGVKISSIKTSEAKMKINTDSIGSYAGAKTAVSNVKDAINYVSSIRGKLGAYQNRLEHTVNNLGATSENMTAAESRIRDVDMAKEMMSYTKNNILVQASQAMLAQANQLPQGVLQLLQ
ncbi:flagellin N-terminal helical domain-containing protein [Lacrimispora sp.]|jgi:flagellin|uniref:flagellin N-terminal helical domain-containing protein n=1 Tax=Lacrimispora sp. TaxID=2719234 RepID=UPI002899DEF4|nr:flagellin [Lacrimispora sp.]